MSIDCATMFAAAFVRCKEKPQTLIVNSCGFYGASAEKVIYDCCWIFGIGNNKGEDALLGFTQ